MSSAAARVARNAAVSAGVEVAGKATSLVLTIVAARRLGQEGFGAFAYALSFAPLVAVLWAWGLGTVMIREAAAQPAHLTRLFSQVVVLRVILAVPVVVVFGAIGAAFRPDRDSATILVLILVAWVVNDFREANVNVGVARQEMVGVSAAVLVDRIASAFLVVFVLLAGLGLVAVGIAWLAGSLIGYVVARRAVHRLGVRFDIKTVERSDMGRMLRSSVYIGMDQIVAQALFRIDAVMLGSMEGDRALSSYAVAYRLLETVLFLSWGAARAVFPAMSEGGPARVKRGLEESVAALAVIYIPFGTGLLVAGPGVVALLFGDEYLETASGPVRWLAPAAMLFAVSYLAGQGLLALARPRATFVASLIAAAFNVAANAVLIPRYQGTGAAFVTSVSFALKAAIVMVFLAKAIDRPRFARGLAAPVAASAVMAGVLVGLRLPVLAEVGIAGCVYAVVWVGLARLFMPRQLTLLAGLVRRR